MAERQGQRRWRAFVAFGAAVASGLSLACSGCGSAASSGHAVYLVPASSCKQWLAFNKGQHLGYVSGIAARAEVPPGHYELGGIQKRIEGELESGCQQAAAAGRASQTKLSSVVPLRSAAAAGATNQSVTPAAFPNSVTGMTRDQQGNTATVTLGSGAAQPLSSLREPTPLACAQTIESAGQSTSTAIAIPFRATAELTSSLKAPMTVDLSGIFSLEPQSRGIQPLSNDTNVSVLWAASYASGEPQCPVVAEAKWNAEALTPHAPAVWEPWLVIAGAITPSDPTGEQTVNRVLIRPGAGVGTGPGGGDLEPRGSGWVDCSVDESIAGPHSEPYLALDPTMAEAYGCVASK